MKIYNLVNRDIGVVKTRTIRKIRRKSLGDHMHRKLQVTASARNRDQVPGIMPFDRLNLGPSVFTTASWAKEMPRGFAKYIRKISLIHVYIIPRNL